MAAAEVAENQADKWNLTWYLQLEICVSMVTLHHL